MRRKDVGLRNVNYMIFSAGILLVLIWLFSLVTYGHDQYRRGYNQGRLAEQQIQQKAQAKQQAAANKLSQDYEKQKAENEVKRDEQKRQITKIVKVPVYSNVCLDASGVQLINQAINER